MWRLVCVGSLLFCTPACSQLLGIDDFQLVDASPIDTPPDAALCYGQGLVTFCLTSPPTTPVTIDTTTFDTAGTSCTQVVPQTGGPELCVVAGTTVTVNNIVVATGARPLVLVASGTITVNGTLDVSSKRNPARVGAGGNFGMCGTATAPGASGSGAGGGAGGTFGTRGASGGLGNGGTVARGVAPAVQALTFVRGGCVGSKGGNAGGGVGGAGGGAVYMIAGTLISIPGAVYASGAGGSTTSLFAGGGGGGSGGLIGLEAPTIAVATAGVLSANGGGGSAGASGTTTGGVGTDGTTATFSTVAPGGTGGGGAGGHGSAGTTVPLAGSNGATSAGGGGGGGGFGFIWVKGNFTGTMVSPAPTINP